MKRKIIIEIDIPSEIRTCDFCGRRFDFDEYMETMLHQCEGVRDEESITRGWNSNMKTCGIWCRWLSEPSMISTVIRMDGKNKVEEMKDDIAKRVAKYLSNPPEKPNE